MGPSTADEVTVPDVVGMVVTEARKVAWDAGVVIAAADPAGPPVRALTWPGVRVVTVRTPAPGSRMRRRGSLVIEFEPVRGSGADARNPQPEPP